MINNLAIKNNNYSKHTAYLLVFSVLILENLLVFFQHYFFDAGFPWDFNQTYFAVPFYWISNAQHGIINSWVAQQAMGYPFFLNLQSGFFYPVFWLLVLMQKTYTMHTAVILQCLHVLFGSFGMFYLCRVEKLSLRYSLLAAVAFQIFGGFYSNSEHADIIRGFSFTPWLLSGIANISSTNSIKRAVLIIPAVIFLFATGGYLGQFIAAVAIAGLFLLFELITIRDIVIQEKIKIFLSRVGLIILGVGLSIVQISPGWLLREWFIRQSQYHEMARGFLTHKNFFSYFLPIMKTSVLPQDVSMRSLFITLPLFCLLYFIRWERIKEHLHYVLLYICVWLLATDSFIYHLLEKYISFLTISRFPSSDYRAFISIISIYFAVHAYKDLLEKREIKLKFFRWLFLLCSVFLGCYIFYKGQNSYLMKVAAFLAVDLFIFYLLAFRKQAFGLFIVFVIINGIVIWQIDHYVWVFSSATKRYESGFGLNIKNLSSESLISNAKKRANRPARLNDKVFKPAWRGYLVGDYMLTDYSGGMQLSAQSKVVGNKKLLDFMSQSSRIKIVDKEIKGNCKGRNLINMISFANDNLEYNVDLSCPRTIIENEMYFPGWSAKLIFFDKSSMKVYPRLTAEGLRSWDLAKGKYRFSESFSMPNLRGSLLASLLALAIWIIVIFAVV